MNSFQVHAVGELEADPDLNTEWDIRTDFCLIAADPQNAGKSHDAVTRMWFVAYDRLARQIAKARKGDKLIVDARVKSWSIWTVEEPSFRFNEFHVTRFRIVRRKPLPSQASASADTQIARCNSAVPDTTRH